MVNNRRVAAATGFAQAVRDHGNSGFSLGQRLGAVPRMIKASLAGQYPGLSRGKLAMLGAAAAYVVSPIDLMPEIIFWVLGLADDLLVGGWLATTLLSQADDYLAWEQHQATPAPTHIIPGEVIS